MDNERVYARHIVTGIGCLLQTNAEKDNGMVGGRVKRPFVVRKNKCGFSKTVVLVVRLEGESAVRLGMAADRAEDEWISQTGEGKGADSDESLVALIGWRDEKHVKSAMGDVCKEESLRI